MQMSRQCYIESMGNVYIDNVYIVSMHAFLRWDNANANAKVSKLVSKFTLQ